MLVQESFKLSYFFKDRRSCGSQSHLVQIHKPRHRMKEPLDSFHLNDFRGIEKGRERPGNECMVADNSEGG